MTIQPAITLLLLVIAFGSLCYAFWQLQRSRTLMRILNSHHIAANSAVQRRRMDLYEIRNRAKLLEDTVSGSASAVEKMHRAISNTTFSLVDHFTKDDEFRQSALKARKTHDQASRQVYHAVRTTNKAIHILADTLFITKAEKRVVLKKVPPKTHRKKISSPRVR
ncbi:hypothetical protein SAMN04488490_0863 [Marinobacter sp. LV10R510-11A]|uniref:hypothetical protein n=1 Tax=Marinobacter sp. LV10R510-11A TaxID=1415568 RepID=UPI000BBFBFC9|nr:hypothetical protein [Marinobacter sp. LV10R510-11A]SOB75298.1 hypothetical protein SAMN04488490_0863 [Marinobacter sp. LV10R510-11A]